ncbi:50S ribosomal protein L21, mitochondrial-like isoform X2 [Hevea brasiliensis]|uniref:50S ribosomal protein L21, mitochondrial-like isoform X2 n=1 Tax=Hevea brasiliensis TaxID=3981 RepID=UPI0025D428E9|nr:50S ribosomal protein L21, mitochondrial-like isoform X2 [Hevea brasiliensis]
MAQRRCLHTLTRQAIALLSSNPTTLYHPCKVAASFLNLNSVKALLICKSSHIFTKADSIWCSFWPYHHPRYFSSDSRYESENDDEDEETAGEDSDGEEVTGSDLKREYTAEEKEEEAAAIGYKVVGPLQKSDLVFKPYEPVFAVVQIGSHQFKVSNGDCIFTEKLKFCEVNDKALDAKVIIFKKKRRKNYRRTKGHRQELTKLRITDIQGIEKPEMKVDPKPKMSGVKQQEKIAVAA